MKRSFLLRERFLILRRVSQAAILLLFAFSGSLSGYLGGLWLLKGNLSASLVADTVPLNDPFVLAQSLAAGHLPELTAVIGAAIVIAFYLLAGGRSFCAWVCPVNAVTDSALWLRRRAGIKGGHAPAKSLRLWLLGSVLLFSAISGSLLWELVNPVSLLQRELIFGTGLSLVLVAAIFVYDLTIAQRGWCGHICPMGAAYGLLGKGALLRIRADKRDNCDDCMDCFKVCPEPQVLKPVLKGEGSSIIRSGACSNCGRCIDVCEQQVFRFGHRFEIRSQKP
ncbi:quinol dehydrogenase ferredoxin subunit NapH [Craterilacuibacter sinensis]|uniref:Quinol dehydrogenase ferredoxin subunit NapH n=1 Tax=Craterilacuibacter sinensis TaxID=2686017 RepID=A0A845BKT9_9NEIS|nr:quinol dehydrogenase ferredoxin subunit NapH [Craterilacuibacter sinensis]MXR37277.1 quinol dehydrogenase ferredoxin subunit NapH [Craterilacuibacter sinensis]